VTDENRFGADRIDGARNNAARADLRAKVVDDPRRQDGDRRAGQLVVLRVTAPARRRGAQGVGVEGVAAVARVGEGEVEVERVTRAGEVSQLAGGFRLVRPDRETTPGN
jgi:hypothetical protein